MRLPLRPASRRRMRKNAPAKVRSPGARDRHRNEDFQRKDGNPRSSSRRAPETRCHGRLSSSDEAQNADPAPGGDDPDGPEGCEIPRLREAKTEVLDFRRFCGTLEKVRKPRLPKNYSNRGCVRLARSRPTIFTSRPEQAERSRQRRKSGRIWLRARIRHDGKGSASQNDNQCPIVKYSGAAEARNTEGRTWNNRRVLHAFLR